MSILYSYQTEILFLFVFLVFILWLIKKRKRKALYGVLGIIVCIILTPISTHLLTYDATDFEGARGYAFMLLMPIVFGVLLVLWIILHVIFRKKTNFYVISTKIMASFIGVTLISLFFLGGKMYYDEIQEYRNSEECQQQYKDSYKGLVIDLYSGNIKIRKLDSLYTEIDYYYNSNNDILKHFYKGQKISKKPNSKKIELILKNEQTKKITLPCYSMW